MQAAIVYAQLALAGVMWGANFNLSKHVLVDLNALVAGAARFDIAALVMLVVSALKRQAVPLIRHGRAYATLGLIGVGGFNGLFFYGMQMTSAVNFAVSSMLISTFEGRPPTWVKMAGGAIVIGAVSLATLGSRKHDAAAGGSCPRGSPLVPMPKPQG